MRISDCSSDVCSSNLVYGSFGRYYLPIATNTNIRLGGSEMDYDRLYYLNGLNPDKTPMLGGPIANADCPEGGGNNCVLRNDGSISPLDSVVASNLENQSVDEYIIGAEQDRKSTRLNSSP